MHLDRRLGDPGIFVTNAERAWLNWERLGHSAVVEHLATRDDALPGMATPRLAARALIDHMLRASQEPGMHVFVSHDAIVGPTAAWLVERTIPLGTWPDFLDGLLVWRADDQLWLDCPGLLSSPRIVSASG